MTLFDFYYTHDQFSHEWNILVWDISEFMWQTIYFFKGRGDSAV